MARRRIDVISDAEIMQHITDKRSEFCYAGLLSNVELIGPVEVQPTPQRQAKFNPRYRGKVSVNNYRARVQAYGCKSVFFEMEFTPSNTPRNGGEVLFGLDFDRNRAYLISSGDDPEKLPWGDLPKKPRTKPEAQSPVASSPVAAILGGE